MMTPAPRRAELAWKLAHADILAGHHERLGKPVLAADKARLACRPKRPDRRKVGDRLSVVEARPAS